MARRILLAAVVLAALAGPAPAVAPRTVAPEAIRALLERRWAETAPAGATMEVRSVPALVYRDGDPLVEVVLPDDPTRPGPRALPVSCRVGGRVVSRGLASVLLRGERTVWTARHPLRPGSELSAEDLRAETRIYEREPTRLFAYEPTQRWRVVREIDAGAQITPVDVREIPDVEAGEEIYLLARAGASTVSVGARARQSGNAGDVILVHNPLTGSLVRAVVVDGNSAEVLTPAGTGEEEEGR